MKPPLATFPANLLNFKHHEHKLSMKICCTSLEFSSSESNIQNSEEKVIRQVFEDRCEREVSIFISRVDSAANTMATDNIFEKKSISTYSLQLRNVESFKVCRDYVSKVEASRFKISRNLLL